MLQQNPHLSPDQRRLLHRLWRDPRPLEPVEQHRQLGRTQMHDAAADRRPGEVPLAPALRPRRAPPPVRCENAAQTMQTIPNLLVSDIEPLVAWLRPCGVNFLTGAFVQDIDFAPSPGRMTVHRLDYTRGGSVTSVAVAPEDLVLVTTGSQAADLSTGSMTEAPRPRPSGRSWALWTRLAKRRPEFGKPDAFFGEARIPL